MPNQTDKAEPEPSCPSPDDCLARGTRCAACRDGSEYQWDPASAAQPETPKGKGKRKKKEKGK